MPSSATILDWLYPRVCAGCGLAEPDTGPALCWDCRAALPTCQPPWCACCGCPVPGPVDHAYRCYRCAAQPPAFDCARACMLYDGVVRHVIHELKYRHALWVVPEVGGWLAQAVMSLYDSKVFDAVIAVPLHPARRRERSYNQAERLARQVADGLQLPLARNALRRVRPTPSQTRLTAAARATNVKQAFAARRHSWLEGKRVLLVDDVMTTGATVNECAVTLKRAGLAEVTVLTAARG